MNKNRVIRNCPSEIAFGLRMYYIMSDEYNLRIYSDPHPHVITKPRIWMNDKLRTHRASNERDNNR